MANNKRDQNFITVGSGVSTADLVTPLMFELDSITNEWIIEVTSESLSTTPLSMDKRDQNHRPTMYGVSDADGLTLIPLRTDEAGKLLVKFI